LTTKISRGWGYGSDMTQEDPVYHVATNPDGEWDGPYGTNMLNGECSLTQYFTGPSRDIYKLRGRADEADKDEYVYYSLDLSSLSLSTDIYTKYALRWKTDHSASPGLGFIANMVYASPRIIQTLTPNNPTPSFSTDWVINTGTLTPGETVASMEFYLDDDPSTYAGGYASAYIDFLILYKDDFTFPMVTDITGLEMPNTHVDIQGINRVGGFTQYMGRESMPIILSGVMDDDTSEWGNPLGDTLLQLWHEASTDPWQLLQCDLGAYKVTLRNFKEEMKGTDEFPRNYTAIMKEFSRSNLSNTIWGEGWKGY